LFLLKITLIPRAATPEQVMSAKSSRIKQFSSNPDQNTVQMKHPEFCKAAYI